MRLYLVRHPQPLVTKGLCYGASDLLCSQEALESAALDLLDVLPKGLSTISSPLSRCEHLAQFLCRLQSSFAYQTDAKLAEMHFGDWEMRPWDQIAQKEMADWTDAFATYRCGGWGESTGQFVQRVAQRLNESAQGGTDEIWITHAGVIRALQWLSGQPFALFTALLGPLAPNDALFSPLRAADWPAGELVFGQVQPWDWPPEWPSVERGSALAEEGEQPQPCQRQRW